MAADGAIKHSLMGGKLHVYRRENSGQWQCSAYIAGKSHRVSTKTDSLAHAKQFAEDWYLTLRGKVASGEVKAEKTFKEAAAAFEREYEIITEGQRTPPMYAATRTAFGSTSIPSSAPCEFQRSRRARSRNTASSAGRTNARRPGRRSTMNS